jgi:hypothetical protein
MKMQNVINGQDIEWNMFFFALPIPCLNMYFDQSPLYCRLIIRIGGIL